MLIWVFSCLQCGDDVDRQYTNLRLKLALSVALSLSLPHPLLPVQGKLKIKADDNFW